jgi:acyl-CoA reductase-like NAD-dependent aldehyde dehydrogenase
MPAPWNPSNHFSEPSTAQVLGTVADCDLDDMKSAIESAHEFQKSYFLSTTAPERANLLRRWHDLVMENVEDRKDTLFYTKRLSLTNRTHV